MQYHIKLQSFPHLISSAKTTRILSLLCCLLPPSGLCEIVVINQIHLHHTVTLDFITKFFVDILIAVFIFFFTQKLVLSAFFSSTLVVSCHSDTQEFDNKSFGFNPSPAKPKLIRRTAYPTFSRRLREISDVQLIALS